MRTGTELPDLPPGSFNKQDLDDDLFFYAVPRLVTHIDDTAIAALTRYYRQTVPDDGRVLDLMSSWISHLPQDRSYADVVGHGMNPEELKANSQLNRWFVQDLNRDTKLPFTHDSFDAALCCVGVQYLQKPLDVFIDVRRTLVSGAPFIISFSNRCFPTKAVAIWRTLDTNGHVALINLYLERAGFTKITVDLLADGQRSDPLIAVTGRA